MARTKISALRWVMMERRRTSARNWNKNENSFVFICSYCNGVGSSWCGSLCLVSFSSKMTLWIARDEDVPSVLVLWVHPELASFYMKSFASTHHTNVSVARSCCWCQVWRKETSRKAKQHRPLLLFTGTNKRRGFNTYWKSWMISYWNLYLNGARQ